MNVLVAILGAVAAIFGIIILHECGHYFMARMLGVKILRFSIGFGKALWCRVGRDGTEYAIAWLPLGGYVKMLGEKEETIAPEMAHRAFNQKPVFFRMLIVLAGPFTNFLIAVVAYWAVYMMGVAYVKPVIGRVVPHSIAAQADVRPGDEVISIDGHVTRTWSAVMMSLIQHMGKQDPIVLVVKPQKSEQLKTTVLNVSHWQMNAQQPDFFKSLGFYPESPKAGSVAKTRYSALSALAPAFRQVYELIAFNAIVLAKMLVGQISIHTLGGPITLFQTAGQASQAGFQTYLAFIGFISLAIGFINLLPIPGLDGGHFLFQILEVILRRPIPERIQMIGLSLGLFVLVLLMVQATINDLTRLFTK